MQETRHWHEDTGITTSGREKSDAEDYRYFPEPDLVPIAPDPAWVEKLRGTVCPSRRRCAAAGCRRDWGFTDLEMRDLLNAGAVDLVEATVAAGAAPSAARKWWSGELARRANADGVELGALAITPAQVARCRPLWSTQGTLNDALARQVVEGVLAGEGEPEPGRRPPAGWPSSPTTARCGAAVDRAIAANPRRRREGPRRQGRGRRGAGRRGDEGDARPGRRRPGCASWFWSGWARADHRDWAGLGVSAGVGRIGARRRDVTPG